MKIFKTLKEVTSIRYARFLSVIFLAAFIAASNAFSIPALDLLSNKDFIFLAGSTITGIPPVNITGNVGLSPAAGSSIVGFDSSDVVGIIYVVDASGPVGSVIDASLLTTAKSDLTTAYNDAAGRTPVPTGDFLNPNGGNIGGLNLVPGLYKFTSEALITGSDVTLTGNNTDVWIFQIATALKVGSNIKVILAGGAQAANVFWQVGSSAVLGTYCSFKGTILADQSVSIGTGAAFEGRALAFSGAVTFESGITSTRSDLKFPIFSVDSNSLDFGNVIIDSTKKDSVIVTNTGNADLIISTVLSSNSLFTVTPTNVTITPGSSQKYYITFAPLTIGSKNGKIFFNHNAQNKEDSISVTGTGVNASAPIFSVNPTSLNFGNVTNGTTKKDSVVVKNIGNANLVLSTITSSNSLFTLTPTNGTIAQGDSMKIYITFAPLTDGVKNGYVYFNHNAANAKDSISVTGTGVTAAAPIFSVNPTSLNFGNVTNGTTKKDSVTVKNIGNANLVLSTITSSNSLFTLTPTNGTIAAGDSIKIYVTFAPLTDGVKNGYVYFNHNAANAKDSISVTGTGVTAAAPIFSVNPASLNFGNVINGTTKKDSVTVTNTGNANLIISTITSSNALFTFTPTSGTIAPGATQKIYVTFAPLTNGVKNGYVYFNHNAANAKDSISVTGTGVTPAAPVFSVNPSSLNFGNVSNGTTKMDSVTVTNTGNANLIISTITSSNALFTFTPTNGTIAPGATQKIYVTFAPLTDGVKNGYVYFNHNAANAKDSISVTGTGVSAKFSAFPMSIDFGDVIVDTFKSESFTVTNTGTANLIISSIVITNAKFTMTPISVTITPGNTAIFNVTFAPTADGLQTGSIYFNHNAGNGRDTINLTGTGVSSKFAVNPVSLNFGNVRNETSKKDSVTVTNTGTSDLIISSVTSSNTTFSVTPAFYTIIPGSSAKFYITFSPIADGFQSGNIYFNHNAKNSKDTVSVTGTGVSPKFSVNPLSLNFGNVRNETSKKDSVTVTNTGTFDLIISSVTSSNTLFTVTPTSSTLTPGTSAKFYITFSPLVDGLQTGNILFNHNAKIPQDVVTVSGTGVSPKFSVTPLNLNFGNVRNETSKLDSVTVTNSGTFDLIINSVTSSNTLFTVTPTSSTLTPGTSAKFYITFSPLVDGLQTGNILFNHNAKIPQDVVTVSGTGVSPKFSVNPLSLNFGNVRNETSKKDSVTVTNTGTSDLIINSITSSNNLFTVNPTYGTITPGSSAKFYITFSPLVDGLQTGNIYFNHNAKIPQNIVTVSGTGVSPKFSVTPLNINFGNVRNETSKKDSVTVTNTGTADLIISSVTSSNNLFTVTPTYYTLLPGTSAKFYITFSPLVDGLQTSNIYFNHNAKIPQNIVTVSGTGVSPKFSVNPNSLDFGKVRNDTYKTEMVTVTNTGTSDLIISSVTSSNMYFTVTPTTGTLAPGASVQYYVIFSPVFDGLQTGNIYFNHNAKIPQNIVTVSGTGVSPKFSVTPLNINFGNVRNETSKKDSVTVTNTGTFDLIISSVTSSNNLFTVTPTYYTLLPGTSAKFYITFSPLVDGLQTSNIYFNHNAKIPQNIVTVSGTGVSPKFSVNPNSLDFGKVRNDTYKTEMVTVTNTGTSDLIISNVTSSNMYFTVTPTTGTLAPGASVQYYVTFSPVFDGLQTGYIYFNHNAKYPKDSVSVSGTGVSPKFSTDIKSLDFGDVQIELFSKTLPVTITNTGTTDLIINNITITNTNYRNTPTNVSIAPGESQIFNVTFAPMSRGQQNGYIYFYHNAKNLVDSVKVTGNGVSPMFIVNIRDLDFGNVTVGLSKTDSITVTNTGEKDLEISKIITTNTFLFNISPTFDKKIKPGETHTFYITFTPQRVGYESGDGPKRAYVYFWHNAPNGFTFITVTGTGVSPKFSTFPKSLNFGNVKIGVQKKDSVNVTNIGTADLIINKITSSNPLFTIASSPIILAPGETRKLFVTFAPLTNGVQNGYIYFNHNALNARDSISVSGTTGIAPVFTISINDLDFGSILINTTKQKSVVVTNTGTIDLNITDINISDNHYTITPNFGTIIPGASLEFFITFAPTVVGTLDGTIQFTHNSGIDVIGVTGIGITVISIKEARELPIGTEFAVEGTATRTLGSYTRIQDQSAAITIIQESGNFYNDVLSHEITMGDKIRVQGKISEKDNLKVINGIDLISYERLYRSNSLPTAIKVTLDEIANNGEQYESCLITLENLTIPGVKEFNFNAATTYQTSDISDITNAVVIRIGNSTDTHMDGMPFIGTYMTFEGVLSQSSQNDPTKGYQLTPVLTTDLRQVISSVAYTKGFIGNSLYDNYPNPFNTSTTIEYNVEKANYVTLKVLDELGNEITSLVNKFQDAGNYSVNFSTKDLILPLNNGTYFYSLKVGQFITSKKMLYVK